MLLALAAVWGASFMFIKIGDRELQPITLVGLRMALGALTLVPIVLVTGGAGGRLLGNLLRRRRPLRGSAVAWGLAARDGSWDFGSGNARDTAGRALPAPQPHDQLEGDCLGADAWDRRHRPGVHPLLRPD